SKFYSPETLVSIVFTGSFIDSVCLSIHTVLTQAFFVYGNNRQAVRISGITLKPEVMRHFLLVFTGIPVWRLPAVLV
ncbi:MAG: hypothetical protein ACXWL9_05740, partial [Syntrophales bacterium]